MTRHALRTTLAVIVVVALAGCGTRTGPARRRRRVRGATASPAANAGEAFADADWSEWTSTYTDVRPADEAALEGFVKRTTALNESAWTAEVEPDWLQITTPLSTCACGCAAPGSTCTSTRARSWRSLPFTVCDDACSETSLAQEHPGAQGGSLPARFGSAIAVLATQLTMERLSGQIHDADVTGYLATLGSPVGPLDCFVTTPDGTDASELEGTPMVLDEPGAPTPVICVDARGLAIMPPGGNLAPSYSRGPPGSTGTSPSWWLLRRARSPPKERPTTRASAT